MSGGDGRKGDEQLSFDNVIAFPVERRAEMVDRPDYRDAVDAILSATFGDDADFSPLVSDVVAATATALFRDLIGEPYALGPPASPADIVDGPPAETLADAAESLVETLVALGRGAATRRPDLPDAQVAVDAIHALSIMGGPLAEPAARALAENGFRPAAHMANVGTAVVEAAHLLTYAHGDSFELLLELRYPDQGANDVAEPGPIYLVSVDTFDGPEVSAVTGSDDSGELLATLRADVADPDHGITLESVSVAEALATVDAGLEAFNTRMGAAADPEGAAVAYQRLFMGGLITRGESDRTAAATVLRPGAVDLDDAELGTVAGQLAAWITDRRPDLADAAAEAALPLVRMASERAGHPRRWTLRVAGTCLALAGVDDQFDFSPATLEALGGIVRLAIGWSEVGVGDSQPVGGTLPRVLVEGTLEALDELESSIRPPIPPELAERFEVIAEAALSVAISVFDTEFAGIVRGFIADCALEPHSPLGRGRAELWASGAVYAVAQLNDIPGGWGPLSMEAKELTGRLPGAHSTIVAKARELRELLELDLYGCPDEYRHSSSDQVLVDFLARQGGLGQILATLGDPDEDFGAWSSLTSSPSSRSSPAPTGVLAAGGVVAAEACFVLYVSLIGSKPMIWRRIRVPVRATFGQLHTTLQLAFGWYDCHLHDFDIDGYRIGQLSGEFGADCDADESETQLGDLLGPGDHLLYTYDYGDDWGHAIVVEDLEADGASREYGPWAVLGGEMAGPPEDCGGVWGYRELLKAHSNRRHPRHGEVADHLPVGFNPKHFDLYTVNQAVRSLHR